MTTVLEAIDQSRELERVQNERLALGEKWTELEHTLFRATLPPGYQPLNPHFLKQRLVLTPEQLWQLKVDIWDTRLQYLNLGIREHELRFGADGVPEWLIECRDQHRVSVPKR